MEIDCRNLIKELHVFIESWLKGTVEKSKQEFQYFEDEFDDDFIIIHPSGEIQAKMDILSDFWGAYGAQSENFKIEIRNIKTRIESKDICLMNYEEWQTGTENSIRISTVIFRKSKKSNKNVWLHLHETWCPNK